MLFFHCFFFWSNLPFLLSEAPSAFGPSVSLPAAEHSDGAQARPWGAGQEQNPRDNWSGHGHCTNQQPSLFYPLHPKQTFALQLSSEASQKRTPTLLSGNANHGLHSPALSRKRRKRVGKGDTGNERCWRNRKEGARADPWATRQSQSLWKRQTRRQDSIPIDMHKQGPSSRLLLKQKGKWGEKDAL